MSLEESIRTVIEEHISSGNTFDSHVVIELLKKEHEDEYRQGHNEYTTDAAYHSHISKLIGTMTDLVEPVNSAKNDSYNLHENVTPCHSWKKK